MNFLVYTNCQGDEIRKYLKYSDEFNKRFTGEACFMPHHFNGRDPVVPIQLLENTDLFIYQPFSSRRGVLNTVDSNGVMKYLKKDSLKISFPSLYCDIFPIYEEDQIDGFHYYYGPSLKLVRKIKGLKKVEGLLSEGFNKDQIVKMFQNYELNFQLKERFDYCMDYMKIKEKECSIIASKFIEDNYKNKRLFDTQLHPTEILLGYITNEIFKKLGIDFQFNLDTIDRFIIGSFRFEDSIYMKNELGIEYISEVNENYYLSVLLKYLESPDKFLLRGIEHHT